MKIEDIKKIKVIMFSKGLKIKKTERNEIEKNCKLNYFDNFRQILSILIKRLRNLNI